VTTFPANQTWNNLENSVEDFHQRVETALLNSQNSRQFVDQAVRRRGGARLPFRLNRFSSEFLAKHSKDLADLCCEYPDDAVFLQPYEFFRGYQPESTGTDTGSFGETDLRWHDEWGVLWGRTAESVSAVPLGPAILDWRELDDYLRNRLPNPNAPGRLDRVVAKLALLATKKYTIGGVQLALFERFQSLRGMEHAFMDLYDHEVEVHHLLDGLTDYLLKLIRRWGETKADALFLTDDWGTQRGMMVSPVKFRKIFRPYYKQIFDEIHRLGMHVHFHSCGNIMQIIPDLIELGVDVLDNVQPDAMDLAEVSRRFAGQMTFSGGIHENSLRHMSRTQIREMVNKTMDLLGRKNGGGFIVSPCNVVTIASPIESVRALFEECHRCQA
jgi:uroporphyrinogen decarboxylase